MANHPLNKPPAPKIKPLLGEIMRASKGQIWEAVFISLITNILAMAVPIFVMQIYDRVVVHRGITTLQGLVIMMVVVILFDTILRYGRARLFQRVGLRVDAQLGKSLYGKITKLPLKILEKRDVSSWQTAFRDIDTIRATLAGPAMITVLDLPFAIIFMLVIYTLAPDLMNVFFVIVPLYCLLAWWSGRVISKLSEDERQEGLNRDMFLHELLNGRQTVKSLALERAFQPRYESSQSNAIRSSMSRGSSADLHQVLSQSMQLSTTIMLTTVGALLILDQQMSMGTLIAVNMLSARMVAPIAGLVGQWRMVQSFRQALQRLSEIYAMPSEREDANLPLERPKGSLRLENLQYNYNPDAPAAITNITGTIGPSGLHCLIGRNGAGKSTLLKLLSGLYQPDEGRILLDGADIGQFSRRDLASWVGYLPQDCLLFADTIRGNIQLGGMPQGYQGSLDDRMVEASMLVGSHEAIIDLPDGYDTVLGEAGYGLSSGQRRRIALARAMMPDPPVLLMDEPTSDLDTEGEEILIRNLKALSAKHTLIIATHSPAILTQADSILLMDRGKVNLAGPAKTVLEKLDEMRAARHANYQQQNGIVNDQKGDKEMEETLAANPRDLALAALRQQK